MNGKASLAAALLTLLSTSAMAQITLPNGGQASNVVSFGDSLSDRGSLSAVTFGTQPPAQIPGAPAGVGYFGGQFSNGPVFTRLLADRALAGTGAVINPLSPIVGIPAGSNVNFAVAGATTTGGGVPGTGLNSQVASFLAPGRNGIGSLGPNAVVTVLIGGNDLANGLTAALAVPATAQATLIATAQTAAASAGTSVGQIAAAGARTIIVLNSPDITVTPRLIGTAAGAGPLGPTIIQLGRVGVGTFNTALAAQMAGVAAANPGANIVTVDLAKALTAVVANPAGFGFVNATGCGLGAFGGVGCAGAPSANPDSLLFWDNFHPTAAGHQFLANLTADYLGYGASGAAYAGLTDSARTVRALADQSVQSRMMLLNAWSRFGVGQPGSGVWNATLNIEGAGHSANRGGPSATMVSGRAFFDRAFTTDSRGGVALSYTRSIDGKSGRLGFEADSFSLDAFASWAPAGGFFVNGRLGMTVGSYANLRRQTLVTGAVNSASTRALGVSAATDIGYTIGINQTLSLSPYASLRVNHVNVEKLTETADITAALQVGSRTTTFYSGDLAMRLDAALAHGIVAHAVVGWNQPFSRAGGRYAVSLVGNTAQPVTLRPSFDNRGGILLGAGATGQVGQNLNLSVEYRGVITMERGREQTHSGRASLSMRF